MNVVLWIVAGLLAAAMLAAGAMKSLQPKEKLIASGMGWAQDYSAGQVKAIGVLEVLGAIGLILPALLDIAPILVPIAATGLAVTMIGAVVVHVRRNEIPGAVPSVVLFLFAAVVAWGRFGPYAF
ncbi:MAG TPA: DoxX family protein [Actinoplanes sp.]|nr:DoxX family protein [Actinoplanes sp.]